MKKKLGLLLLIALMWAAFFWFDLGRYFTFESVRAEQTHLQALVDAHPLLSMLAYIGAYVLLAALSLPGAGMLTLIGGALFGFWVGVPLATVAASAGALAALLVSRYLFRASIERRFGQRLKPINAGLEREGAYYLFTMRLVPVMPYLLINLLMGLTTMSAWRYLWVSALGMIPAEFVYVYAGTQLRDIERASDILRPGIVVAFAMLALLPLLLRGILGWLRMRKTYRGHRKPRRFDYNLLVIGAGTGGLVSAYIAAAAKAKVALIEKGAMGGDCLNTGCVPSKTLLRSARLLADVRESAQYGIAQVDARFDFAQMMAHVHNAVAKVAPHDSIERYRSLGVDVIEGEAKLVSPWEVEVGGRRLCARSLVIATGATPSLPEIPGLADCDPLTSENVWSLRELPRRLLVLGGGPIGCELAQAFRRFGSEVTVLDRAGDLLSREDEDASAYVEAAFVHEGIHLALKQTPRRIERDGDAFMLIADGEDPHGGQHRHGFDRILVALGRTPRVTGFGLEQLGVTLTERGKLQSDPFLRTNFPNIYACGDVTEPFQFTHTAAHQAWYASVNALLAPFWSFRADYRVIPWCTFTDPELARVGLNEHDAREKGIAFEITRYDLDELDRAIADGEDNGFVKVLTPPNSDRILGATIVGRHAGELIAEFVLAMKHGIGLKKILGTIHTYPTWMEANRGAAGAWQRAHSPSNALRWAERLHRWRRG